jgi:hypothetical protein
MAMSGTRGRGRGNDGDLPGPVVHAREIGLAVSLVLTC